MSRPLSLLICIAVPIVILLLGIVSSVIFALQALPDAFRDEFRAVIPPKFTVALPEPHRYTVWVYTEGELEGVKYSGPGNLPSGAKIHVIDTGSGDFLPINNWMTGNKSFLGEQAFFVGSFETIAPNQEVEIVGSGLEGETLIGVSARNMTDMFRAVIAIVGIFLISLFLAIATLVVLLHRRKKQILAANS